MKLNNILNREFNNKKINEKIPEITDHQNASAFPCLLLLSPNIFFLAIILLINYYLIFLKNKRHNIKP